MEIMDGHEPPKVELRAKDFMRAVKGHLKAAQLPTEGLGRLLPITLLAPLLPEEGDDDGRKTLACALGNVIEWVVVARRFVRDGGWDQRTGRPFAELAVAAGAVYVARLADDWDTSETLKALLALERDGVGRRRHQGYGHTDDAIPVTPPGGFLVGKTTKGQDE